jgi:hypothetical protein
MPNDAAHMFPQGHGDAYGHYLTALKGYYSLLMNPNFDWVPRIEAVNVLGQPVSGGLPGRAQSLRLPRPWHSGGRVVRSSI